MGAHAAKNILLATLVLVLGLAFGAVTKFGFGYDLAANAIFLLRERRSFKNRSDKIADGGLRRPSRIRDLASG